MPHARRPFIIDVAGPRRHENHGSRRIFHDSACNVDSIDGRSYFECNQYAVGPVYPNCIQGASSTADRLDNRWAERLDLGSKRPRKCIVTLDDEYVCHRVGPEPDLPLLGQYGSRTHSRRKRGWAIAVNDVASASRKARNGRRSDQGCPELQCRPLAGGWSLLAPGQRRPDRSGRCRDRCRPVVRRDGFREQSGVRVRPLTQHRMQPERGGEPSGMPWSGRCRLPYCRDASLSISIVVIGPGLQVPSVSGDDARSSTNRVSAADALSKTESQSPGADCRNKRMDGYHAVRSPSQP